MKTKEIIKINTIEDYTEWIRCSPAEHPLITVNRMADTKDYVPLGKPIQLNLYSIVMKDGSKCTSVYGWREYDFRQGLINFFAPGQIIYSDVKTEQTENVWGWMLVFHPDFIRKYPLSAKIGKLKFFSYETNEALHMSDAERSMIESIMESIEDEIKRNFDNHCQDIIVSHLEVLLNYAERFYSRQFRTRNSVETNVPTQVQSILHRYFDGDNEKIITPNEIASELSMSTHYLSDLLRNLTGMNTQQHIHAYIIEKAKNMLKITDLSVNEIAYSLGFEYPQYFNRLFKSKTGQTPVEFRNMN